MLLCYGGYPEFLAHTAGWSGGVHPEFLEYALYLVIWVNFYHT
jgi:hypothetical protein